MNKTSKGITILELMVAIGLSGLVLSIASMMYIKSTRQFHDRVQESDLFRSLHLINLEIENRLVEPIDKCDFGRVHYFYQDESRDLKEELKTRHPNLGSITFKCYELDPITRQIVTWETKHSPDLIEYSGTVVHKGITRTITGSVLR